MNIQTTKTPLGWTAIDQDTYEGPDGQFDSDLGPVGCGHTEQDAIDDLCAEMGLPYSIDANTRQRVWL